MVSITDKIIRRIRAKKRGWVFSPKDFLDLSSRGTVDQVLSRLVIDGMIRRVDRGIYDFPKSNPYIGTLSPDLSCIAKLIATKKGNNIFCSGASAANLLGLSTQVPAKDIYLTNGASRTKRIGNNDIILKHASVVLFDHLSLGVNLTIQALAYLGKQNIDNKVIQIVANKLSNSDKAALSKTVAQIPAWMVDVVHKIQGLNG